METRLGGDRANGITNQLPFDNAIHIDTIGYAGGLWLLWNSDRVDITLLSKMEQEINVTSKVCHYNCSWLLFVVYASPRLAKRSILWENLSTLSEMHSLLWVIAGDFNEPLNDEDKFGGRGVSVNRFMLFKECLDKCNMLDLGFLGLRFTWTNRRDVNVFIQERIDRYFVNHDRCAIYLEARVTHLTRCHSDHCPVLLETLPSSSTHILRPFKFQSFWLSGPTFPSLVSKEWAPSRKLPMAIEGFTQEAQRWNKLHFGNILAKKKPLLARLNGIQRALANGPSSFHIELERKLHRELEVVLDQERDLWALKSRVNWMILGDRNTAFFHILT
ncbi:uncharacterized protein LOC126696003 [Quercus robur]|uniref:uncharacterized protein LOC126696003 n=1 Tax=Quercus robur TaxID=38942 RepID=UPI0021633DF1|nr:uncharacterized protein LOC126696003 [Quercus robur]